MRQSGSIEVEGVREKMFELVDPHPSKDKDLSTAGHNPWSLRCHKEQLAKMKKNSEGTDVHSILLHMWFNLIIGIPVQNSSVREDWPVNYHEAGNHYKYGCEK